MATSQSITGPTALQLAKKPETHLLRMDSLDDVLSLGRTLAQSGYFSDAKEAAQAVVKILAGKEMGIGPIAAMTGIHVIKGKVSMSSNLMASALKSGGRYDYKVRQLDNEQAVIEFFEHGESLGVSSFTFAEAKAAKLDQDFKDGAWKPKATWQNFRKNMLFARALSNGVKWYCPNFSDRASGPIYTPDELGASVDGETGEVIDATPEPPAPRAMAPAQDGTDAPGLVEASTNEARGRALVPFVTKYADGSGYGVVDGETTFTIFKREGNARCSCASRSAFCQHKWAVKLWAKAQKGAASAIVLPDFAQETADDPAAPPEAIDAEEDDAPKFDHEAHQKAFEAQAPTPEEPDPALINKSQLIVLCELTKKLEAAGIDELTWRDHLETITGSRSRKGVMQDELAKVIFAFNKALESASKKQPKKK